jgi:hypothetical protein
VTDACPHSLGDGHDVPWLLDKRVLDAEAVIDDVVVVSAALLAVERVTAVYAEPIASKDIYVLDGNTIDMHGEHIRLVGFDAGQTG